MFSDSNNLSVHISEITLNSNYTMPITQVLLNTNNQAALKAMVDRLAPEFAAKPYTINDLTLNHSTRGIIQLAQVIYRSIPEKMIEQGLDPELVFPLKSMDVNGYCGYLYRLFLKHF